MLTLNQPIWRITFIALGLLFIHKVFGSYVVPNDHFVPNVDYVPDVDLVPDHHCISPGTMCFWTGGKHETWSAARTACQSSHGDLAVIETEELFNFVLSKYFDETDVTYWIGLTDLESKTFRWLNGAPLYYDKWGGNNPDRYDGENYGIIHGNTLHDTYLSYAGFEFTALCSAVVPPCTAAEDGCSNTMFGTNRIDNQMKGPDSYYEAELTCLNEGKQLLTVRNSEKENLVKVHYPGNNGLWLDLTDRAVETVFRWSDGFVVTWTNWYPEHPEGGQDMDCVMRLSDGRWLNVDCIASLYYYCQEPDTIGQQEKNFRRIESKVAARNIIKTRANYNHSKCRRECIIEPLCRAYSLDEDYQCVISYSWNEADLEVGPGITYIC